MTGKIKFLKNNHFVSAGVLMIVGNNIINLFNFVYHFVMGRMLTPASYGELASLISLVGLMLIIPSSFGLAITRMVATNSEDPKIKQTLNWILKRIFIASAGISLILCLISPVISGFLKISNTSFVIFIGLFFTVTMIAYIYKSILQGLLKFGKMILAMTVETFTKLILGIIFVYLGFSVFGALGAILLAAVLGLFISKMFVGDFLKVKKNSEIAGDKIKELFLYSVPVTIYTIAQTSLFSADLILVKHFFSGFEAGLYAALSSLGKIIFFGAGPIVFVMFPMISQKFAKKENYLRIFLLSLAFTLAVCGGLLLLYYFSPELVIITSVGPQYLQAAGILFYFGIFMTLVSISNLLINFMLSLKRTKVVVLPAIAAILQIILINYFHSSLTEVVYVSISTSLCLLITLIIFSLIKNEK